MEFNLLFLPALLALLFKAGIFTYARLSSRRNLQTRLYLAFLGALALQNIAELWLFRLLQQGLPADPAIQLYYAATIPAIALLFHLGFSFTPQADASRYAWVPRGVYAYSAVLLALLVFTPWVIAGAVPMNYSATRVPGPLYFLFEVQAIGTGLAVLGMLLHGARARSTAEKRVRASAMLLALVPMIVIVIAVVVLLHLEIHWFNATAVVPVAVTYFLAVTAYAVHQRRLFEIRFFIPGSRVRRSKTVFYARIRALISEIADLGTVGEAVRRLSDTLCCPVVLLSGREPVLSPAAGADIMASFPRERLSLCDEIVVASEIQGTFPDLYHQLRKHQVAAVVPFYPHSQQARGWLLLGDSFSESVYSGLDFRVVEELFTKLGELFLDRLMEMRAELNQAHDLAAQLAQRNQMLESRLHRVEHANTALRRINERVLRDEVLSSQVVSTATPSLPEVILLARDKEIRNGLREWFPQTQSYVSVRSRGFLARAAPELLVARVENDWDSADNRRLSEYLVERPALAVVLFGPGAAEFGARNADRLGGVIAVMEPAPPVDRIARQLLRLRTLRAAIADSTDPAQPLIGEHADFRRAMASLRAAAGFDQPLWIVSQDGGQARAAAAWVHRLSGRQGGLRMADDGQTLAAQLRMASAGDTLALSGTANPEGIASEELSTRELRLVRILSPGEFSAPEDGNVIVVKLPSLSERASDLPLLAHFFELAWNLRARQQRWLDVADLSRLAGDSVARLRQSVRTALETPVPESVADNQPGMCVDADAGMDLDTLVSAYESGVIRQALSRSGGNKSRAARILGIRPNTLHYKMERYGLGATRKRKPRGS